MMTNSC